MANVFELIQKRFVIGWERYGCGLLNPKNDYMNYKNELVEELLDAVIYASADAIRKTPQISVLTKTKDDGSVKIELKVNYELDHDGNDAVFSNIVHHKTRPYKYVSDVNTPEIERMLMCLNALEYVIKN